MFTSRAFTPILLFTAVSLWSRNVLFHWAAPGYLFLFPLLGAWLDRKPARAASAVFTCRTAWAG